MANEILDVGRLAAVARTRLLDTEPDEPFDRLARLAAALLDAPFALVTIVDDSRSFWKSAIGVEKIGIVDRNQAIPDSFCQYVVASGERLFVEDAAQRSADCRQPDGGEPRHRRLGGVPPARADRRGARHVLRGRHAHARVDRAGRARAADALGRRDRRGRAAHGAARRAPGTPPGRPRGGALVGARTLAAGEPAPTRAATRAGPRGRGALPAGRGRQRGRRRLLRRLPARPGRVGLHDRRRRRQGCRGREARDARSPHDPHGGHAVAEPARDPADAEPGDARAGPGLGPLRDRDLRHARGDLRRRRRRALGGRPPDAARTAR